ncbi:hypothetical protein BN1708_018916, partial [Verticillium longisporum]
HH